MIILYTLEGKKLTHFGLSFKLLCKRTLLLFFKKHFLRKGCKKVIKMPMKAVSSSVQLLSTLEDTVLNCGLEESTLQWK